jgi:uncharacterized membrane protein
VTERRVRTAIAAVASVGISIAAYLIYVRYSGARIACTSGGCETVQQSSYATLAGVPIAVLGLAAYLVILVSALVPGDVSRAVGAGTALAGVGFGAYLLYVQLAVINAVCEWCLASDVTMTALAVLTLGRVVAAFPQEAQRGLRWQSLRSRRRFST